ncbi:MAG: sigma-70 family RNA polymerase sigma factor [Gemmataceae bacterium]|nr:sigma-70 family RNA polymerase sigma factor [Gemmataceae bacterium]MDW8243393.1 sigma-70 family RNA polymerase sigma factor [Thermogemmata sp.]
MDGEKSLPTAREDSARREEFERLYAQHSREIWAVAYARWMDNHLAFDIMQETFLRLWRQWEAGEVIDNPRAWLLRVARNLAEDAAKSAFRRHGTHSNEVLNGVAAQQPAPFDGVERLEQQARLRQLLLELSPTDREILTLRYAWDYDTPQIAEYLNIAVAAVHMRLSRARQRLAALLKREQHREASPTPTPTNVPLQSTKDH